MSYVIPKHHSFPGALRIDWPNQATGKENLIKAIGPEVEAQSTKVAMVVQYTEIQVQVAGTRKRKGLNTLIPNLKDQALQEFLDAPEPVRCNEITRVLSPTSRNSTGTSASKSSRRKIIKFKARLTQNISSSSTKVIKGNQWTEQLQLQVFHKGEEAAQIKPPTPPC